MSTPPPYGGQPNSGQYPGQAPNPYGAPAQAANPYAGQAPVGNPYAGQAPAPAAPYGQPAAQPYPNQAPPAQPYGQPYQGQPQDQPYPGQGQAPGQVPGPGGVQQPAAPQYAQPQYAVTPAKKSFASRFGGRLAIRLGVLIVLVAGAGIYAFASGDPSTASVGDCVQNKGTESSPDVSVISCSDPKAAYKVLKTSSGSDDKVCDNVPGVDVAYTQTGRDDLVLCLGKNPGH